MQAQLENLGPQLLIFGQLIVAWVVSNLFAIKVLAVLASFVFIVGIVYLSGKTLIVLREFKGLTWRDILGISHRWPKRYLKIWHIIESNVDSGEKQRMRSALIEADNVFFELLDIMGYQGETFDERMEAVTTAQFSNLHEIKQAHQFVFNIAKNVERKFTQEEAEEILDIYRSALEEVEALRS